MLLATASLFQPLAYKCFGTRAQLQRLNAGDPRQARGLITDEERKSCTADTDYRQFCSSVAELNDASEPQQGLGLMTAEAAAIVWRWRLQCRTIANSPTGSCNRSLRNWMHGSGSNGQ